MISGAFFSGTGSVGPVDNLVPGTTTTRLARGESRGGATHVPAAPEDRREEAGRGCEKLDGRRRDDQEAPQGNLAELPI